VSVWDDVVGQPDAVEVLRHAAAAALDVVAGRPTPPGAMTHAWLLTGPPGSGRSVAARAFAAALQCPTGGCGTCPQCRTALAGTSADVDVVVPEGLSIKVAEARRLVLAAGGAPVGGRWRVILVEDADRLTEEAADALLRAVEEPPQRAVFLLCAPSTSPDDVPVTIRSRCRVVRLRVPAAADVAQVLQRRDGVDEPVARWAAQVSQGHVGRARRLARDPEAQRRRRAVLDVPKSLTGVGACFDAADELITAAEGEAATLTSERDAAESDELRAALGAGGTGKGAAGATRGTAGVLKDLERRQRARSTRAQRDALDRALVDLAAFYRDVLVVGLGAPVPGVHADLGDVVARAAASWPPESVLRRLEAVLACRTALESNVKPRIAVEAMTLALHAG